MENLQIDCILNTGCTLGEGPVWSRNESALYWVDILACKIYRYQPADGKISSWTTPEYVAFIIIRKDNSLIAGFGSGLHKVILKDDGTLSALRFDRVDENLAHIRFNDAISDMQGGIWACTMDMRNQETLGKYFYYDHNLNRTVIDDGYIVANGPALSPNEDQLYTVETVGNAKLSKGIYVSEITTGKTLENKRLLIDWSSKNSYPDGIITDAAGNLWIGEFGGNVLRCYLPNGKIKNEISLPAWNITKPVFANEMQDIIYVTSARLGVDEDTLSKYPHTGGIIQISNVSI